MRCVSAGLEACRALGYSCDNALCPEAKAGVAVAREGLAGHADPGAGARRCAWAAGQGVKELGVPSAILGPARAGVPGPLALARPGGRHATQLKG
jgi:hypothetical protein